MDAIKCLKTRRSVRTYEDKEIDKNVIKDIIDCARLAPSANNVQPWEFVVVTDGRKLKKLADLTGQSFIGDAACCITVVCKDSKYYLEDGCNASMNILLAARAYGIGSCWVAGDKKPYSEKVLETLEVPEDYKLVSILPLGYGEFPGPHGKRKEEEVLHWNGF